MAIESRPQNRMGPPKTPPAINSTIKALLEGESESETPLAVQEVSESESSHSQWN